VRPPVPVFYDNTKTAVEAILVGKDRLLPTIACLPSSDPLNWARDWRILVQ
jgi:hypothetical protein